MLSKRVAEEDYEEWDDNAPAMTDTMGTPNLAKENRGLYYLSGKWKYTDSKHEKPLTPDTLREMNQKMAHNQLKYYQQLDDKGNYVTLPWKYRPPTAISLQAENIGEGKHVIRGATDLVLSPGYRVREAPLQVPKASLDLHDAAKVRRIYGRYHGLHGEEVNGAERAHEGKEPFKDTLNSAYATILPYKADEPPAPLRACDQGCAKQIKHNGGTDINEGYPDSVWQQVMKNRSKKKEPQPTPDSGDSYDPNVGDVIRG